jgi:hypothetical protein
MMPSLEIIQYQIRLAKIARPISSHLDWTELTQCSFALLERARYGLRDEQHTISQLSGPDKSPHDVNARPPLDEKVRMPPQ